MRKEGGEGGEEGGGKKKEGGEGGGEGGGKKKGGGVGKALCLRAMCC